MMERTGQRVHLAPTAETGSRARPVTRTASTATGDPGEPFSATPSWETVEVPEVVADCGVTTRDLPGPQGLVLQREREEQEDSAASIQPRDLRVGSATPAPMVSPASRGVVDRASEVCSTVDTSGPTEPPEHRVRRVAVEGAGGAAAGKMVACFSLTVAGTVRGAAEPAGAVVAVALGAMVEVVHSRS